MTVRQHRLSVPEYPSDYIYPSDKIYPLNEDWEAGPIALLDTTQGLNNQAWHLTYLADAPPPPYNPDMMRYDGSTGYYDKTSVTYTGNKFTIIARINFDDFTGDTFRYLSHGAATGLRFQLVAYSSDYSADAANANYLTFLAYSSTATFLFYVARDDLGDGLEHTIMFSYDGDAGAGQFIVDGVDGTDLSFGNYTAPIAGTLSTGVAGSFSVGSTVGSSTNTWLGDIGYVGYRDAYLTNWSDFMDGNQPKQLDETTWTEWGAQPLFWRDTGDMELSLGTEGAMTKNGTITQVPADTIPGVFQGFQVTPEDTGDPVSVLSGVDSVQCGLAFDQNAHVTIVWVDSFNAGHLYWYDTTVGDWIITDFQNPVAGVGLTLDDKRLRQTGASDILLWYTLAVDGHHEIYTREQRDRFDVPYPMQPGLAVWPYFKKLGMADELRVQMDMTNVGPP